MAGRKIDTPLGPYWQDDNGQLTVYRGQDQAQPQAPVSQPAQSYANESASVPVDPGTPTEPTPPETNGQVGVNPQGQATRMPYYAPTQTETFPSGYGAIYPPIDPSAAPGTPGSSNAYTGTFSQTPVDPNAAMYEQLLGGDAPQITAQQLPENPQISSTFSTDENNAFVNTLQGAKNALAFDNYQQDVPTMQAQQLDLGGVPQPQAQQVGSNSALDFLMSGQGYDPRTLAMMRGQATDTNARGAIGQLSSAKMAAQQAGLDGSGADLAMRGQVARRLGDTEAASQNAISVNNAQTGLENLRQAAPMELGRATTNAGSANQMALENAARLFSGMQQNVANSQQAAGTNTSNQNQMLQTRAGIMGGALSQLYNNYSAAGLDRANQADFANTSNSINRNLNQANLNQGTSVYNTNLKENRYGNALNLLSGAANGANPNGLYSSAAGMAGMYSPNLIPAQTYSNLGTSLINAASSK